MNLSEYLIEAVSRGLHKSGERITKEMLLKHDSAELETALELAGFTQNDDIKAMIMGDRHGAISSSEPQFSIEGFPAGTSIWLYPGNISPSMYYIQLDSTGIRIKYFFMVNHSKNGTVRSVSNTNSTTYWITDEKEAIDLLKDMIMVVN